MGYFILYGLKSTIFGYHMYILGTHITLAEEGPLMFVHSIPSFALISHSDLMVIVHLVQVSQVEYSRYCLHLTCMCELTLRTRAQVTHTGL